MEKLKNIKPNEIIYIDFISYGILILFVIFILGCLIVLLSFLRKKRKFTLTQKATTMLKNIDLDNLSSKQIAYLFTKYGRISLNKYYEDEYLRIVKQLEVFKYKKDTPEIDADLKLEIQEYIKVRL